MWFLIYHYVVTITINSRISASSPKETPHLLESLPILFPLPLEVTEVFSLWICLFWTFHKNEVILYVAFCV